MERVYTGDHHGDGNIRRQLLSDRFYMVQQTNSTDDNCLSGMACRRMAIGPGLGLAKGIVSTMDPAAGPASGGHAVTSRFNREHLAARRFKGCGQIWISLGQADDIRCEMAHAATESNKFGESAFHTATRCRSMACGEELSWKKTPHSSKWLSQSDQPEAGRRLRPDITSMLSLI